MRAAYNWGNNTTYLLTNQGSKTYFFRVFTLPGRRELTFKMQLQYDRNLGRGLKCIHSYNDHNNNNNKKQNEPDKHYYLYFIVKYSQVLRTEKCTYMENLIL